MKLFSLALLLICPWFAGTIEKRIQSGSVTTRFLPHMRPTVNVHALIEAAALKHNVQAAFVKSIVAVESNFNCDAVSPRGAIGLMQLMPQTASQFHVDPTDPAQNIDGGTRYLSYLLNKYHRARNGLSRAIAAYNAGPAVVDRYRGIPPFRETRQYVARVLKFMQQFRKA